MQFIIIYNNKLSLSIKFVINMCSGSEFVKRIDECLNELNLTRKEFCETIKIIPSTMATWKTRNILPPVETIEKIAQELHVSCEWLLFGTTFYLPDDNLRGRLSRTQIRNRIYSTIASKLKIQNADNEETHSAFFSNIPDLRYKTLLNWSKGLINLDLYLFEDIAYTLGVSIDYLFSGKEESNQLSNDNDEIDMNIYNTALRNLNDLFCLDNLTEERRQLAKDMLNQLMELEHLKYAEKQNAEKKE